MSPTRRARRDAAPAARGWSANARAWVRFVDDEGAGGFVPGAGGFGAGTLAESSTVLRVRVRPARSLSCCVWSSSRASSCSMRPTSSSERVCVPARSERIVCSCSPTCALSSASSARVRACSVASESAFAESDANEASMSLKRFE